VLAKANSQDPSSSARRRHGLHRRGATVEPFDTAAFSIPLEPVSDPIRSQEFGYHIIKVLDRRALGYKPFEDGGLQIGSSDRHQIAQGSGRRTRSPRSPRASKRKAVDARRVADSPATGQLQRHAVGCKAAAFRLGFNQPLVTGRSTQAGRGQRRHRNAARPVDRLLAGIPSGRHSPRRKVKAQVESDAKIPGPAISSSRRSPRLCRGADEDR